MYQYQVLLSAIFYLIIKWQTVMSEMKRVMVTQPIILIISQNIYLQWNKLY